MANQPVASPSATPAAPAAAAPAATDPKAPPQGNPVSKTTVAPVDDSWDVHDDGGFNPSETYDHARNSFDSRRRDVDL
jgi:hypothetical protein